MKRYTSYADRQEIVALHEQGNSYQTIAQQTRWSYEVVRKICRAYKRHQGKALQKPSTCQELNSGTGETGLSLTFRIYV